MSRLVPSNSVPDILPVEVIAPEFIVPTVMLLVVVAPLSVTESNVSVSAKEVAVTFVKLLPSPCKLSAYMFAYLTAVVPMLYSESLAAVSYTHLTLPTN